ncbi:ATP-binding cassette domain-containing protein [Kitasatospora sp. NPDC091335]|uniref:ABC transporter ATP-binding protein n=1 Tax=Kitasatospora sp. NPDC091335 TaxID=3364085 RepID=UPI0038270278
MSLIEVAGLVKEFRRPKRIDGPFGGLRTLLTRQYTSKLAVDGIEFSIGEGELVGYLGPNGAGKSTTVKMLAGILRPTAGHLEVAGVVPWRERERHARNIGVVFGQRSQLWWDLPLRDSLETVGRLYGVERTRYRRNITHFTDMLMLGPFLDTPVRQLSLGQRMRGDLAAAMLPEPRILFLDEPTIGLDIIARERMREFIATQNRVHGTSVVLTTHDLGDVERLCTRIILIDGGRVLYDGAVDELKTQFAPHRELVFHLAEGTTWQGVDLPGVECVRSGAAEPGVVSLRFAPKETQSPEIIAAVLARHRVTDLSITESALEGVIHRIYSGSEGG